MTTFEIIQVLPGHKRSVNAVKFSLDGRKVVSCGSDFKMKVIDLRTGTILFSKGEIGNKNKPAKMGNVIFAIFFT